MIASGVAEVFSLAAVLPFLAVLTNPDWLLQVPVVQELAGVVGIQQASRLILPATVIFAAAALLAAVVRLTNLWLSGRLAAAIGSDFSCEIYRLTLYQPYEVHVQRNTSRVITAATSQLALTVVVIQASLQIATAVVVALGLLAALVLADWYVAFISIAVFGSAYGFLAIMSRHRLATNSAVVARASDLQLKALNEGLGAIRDVLLDDSQATYLEIYRQADRPLRLKQAQSSFIGTFPRYALEALGLCLIAMLALLLSWQRGSSYALIPLLGTLALGSQRLLPALQAMYNGWALIRAYRSSVVDVLEMLDQPMPHRVPKTFYRPLGLDADLSLHGICFRYTNEGRPVLDGINLKICKGERIGIIGETGSGKSTLVDLIMGLLTPVAGKILIDGCDLHDPSFPERLFAWRATIAHVPQSIYLADMSILENIAIGLPRNRIDISRVQLAAKQAQIADFIESMPGGYECVVGERGIRLSGGQRQRIGIARALYKRAQVLVFDEATSALDSDTEAAVMQAIEGLSRDLTIIMIAHRLSTIQSCDRVIRLDRGAVSAEGPPRLVSSSSL